MYHDVSASQGFIVEWSRLTSRGIFLNYKSVHNSSLFKTPHLLLTAYRLNPTPRVDKVFLNTDPMASPLTFPLNHTLCRLVPAPPPPHIVCSTDPFLCTCQFLSLEHHSAYQTPGKVPLYDSAQMLTPLSSRCLFPVLSRCSFPPLSSMRLLIALWQHLSSWLHDLLTSLTLH